MTILWGLSPSQLDRSSESPCSRCASNALLAMVMTTNGLDSLPVTWQIVTFSSSGGGPPGQPPAGAGMMSPAWPVCSSKWLLLGGTVISTYGLARLPVAWQIVIRRWPGGPHSSSLPGVQSSHGTHSGSCLGSHSVTHSPVTGSQVTPDGLQLGSTVGSQTTFWQSGSVAGLQIGPGLPPPPPPLSLPPPLSPPVSPVASLPPPLSPPPVSSPPPASSGCPPPLSPPPPVSSGCPPPVSSGSPPPLSSLPPPVSPVSSSPPPPLSSLPPPLSSPVSPVSPSSLLSLPLSAPAARPPPGTQAASRRLMIVKTATMVRMEIRRLCLFTVTLLFFRNCTIVARDAQMNR